MEYINRIRDDIDYEVRTNLNQFNPEHNEALRAKLTDKQMSYIPSRTNKINKLIDNLIDNHVYKYYIYNKYS